MNALSAMAVSIQGKAQIAVTEDHIEPLNLYSIVSLPPSERKSEVVKRCKEPLLQWVRDMREYGKDEHRRAISERLNRESIIKTKRSKLGGLPDADREQESRIINDLEADLPDVPELPRLFCDDATPESLAAIMAKQGERIGIMEAEGGLFDTIAGRYSNGVPNLDLILKAWSGDQVTVDRKKGDFIQMQKPLLTLGLSVQPEIIRSLIDKPGFDGRGLLARFLYVLPKSLVGYREIETPPIQPSVLTSYATKLYEVLNIEAVKDGKGNSLPHNIRLSNEAKGTWKDFAIYVEKCLQPDGELEPIQAWGGKLSGTTARIAGLLHFWGEHDGLNVPVSEKTMQAAIILAGILTDHAKAAFQLMGADPARECAEKILGWIQKSRKLTFTARDCLRGVRSCKGMEDVRRGLSVLQDNGFIAEKVGQQQKPGRKSEIYSVHPATFEAAK
jgi:hypothetical protein